MPRKPPQQYTVARVQDGAQVRAELSLSQAREECSTLNAQARLQVGTTSNVYDLHGGLVQSLSPIYGSMFHGQIARYEIRSDTGLVIS